MITSVQDLKPCEKKICNLVLNQFNDFVELVFYKKPFIVETGNFRGIDETTGELILKNQNVDKTRKFEIDDDGILKLKNGKKVLIDDIQKTIKSSRNRALDNIFGYTLTNDWQYFVTLTFSPDFVNRSDDEEVKNFYVKFRRELQQQFQDIKILAIPERHPTSNAIHFHCLFGNCDLTKYITKAINPKNNKPILSKGRQVYNLKFFKYGFSTLVKMTGDSLKVANYLTKYIVKDFGNIGYNKKSFYHTQNLNFKTKELYFSSDMVLCSKKSDVQKMLLNSEVYKETEKMIVYRYHAKEIEPTHLKGALLPFLDDTQQLDFLG